jgi:tRNA nucleotidyltransferase/poly(A) polymerase
MSDYMFMLENHLSTDQNRVVAELRTLAAEGNLKLFLTGGAVRDMIAGFPIRDLDFTLEGPALKFAQVAVKKLGAQILTTDDVRKSAELSFPGGVTASIGMARTEKYAKPGGKPQVQAATIYDDLRGRDFTVNAIALSLHHASLGLLSDPANGMGDIARKELRVISNYSFYDDPVRLIRAQRFLARFSYTMEERSKAQYDNARAAEMEKRISAEALASELRSMADEPNPGETLRLLEQEKLLGLFSLALAGPKLNLASFVKLQKARQVIPFGVDFPVNNLALFLDLLLEKLSPKERAQFFKNAPLRKPEIKAFQELGAKAKKLERDLKNPKLVKPSMLYAVASKAAGEQILYLLMNSQQRIVQDRLKNYLQKYLPAAGEITDKDVIAAGHKPGTPKFAKAKEQMIAQKLDARPKKVVVEEAPPPPPPPSHGFARARG